jgi:hypothetical protein
LSLLVSFFKTDDLQRSEASAAEAVKGVRIGQFTIATKPLP